MTNVEHAMEETQQTTPTTQAIHQFLTIDENTQTIEVLHNCAPFIAKLYSLVNSQQCNHLIGWSETHNGQAIRVIDPVQFSQEILPKHFKHSNIASFVRQLNIYGFHKLDCKDGLIFKHEFFQKDCPEMLEKIKRKKNKKSTSLTQPTLGEQSKGIPPSGDVMSVFNLRYDLNKLQNQVESIKAELEESKLKWNALGRKIDQMDQFFNMIYSNNYPNLQGNSQINQISNGYLNGSLPLYPNQRRMNNFPTDDSRHHDQP